MNEEVEVSVLPHSYRDFYMLNMIFSIAVTFMLVVFIILAPPSFAPYPPDTPPDTCPPCSSDPAPPNVSHDTCQKGEAWFTANNIRCDDSKISIATSSLGDCIALCKKSDGCKGVQWNVYDECELLLNTEGCKRKKGSLIKLPPDTVADSTTFLTYDTCLAAFSQREWHRFNSLWNSKFLPGVHSTICASSEVVAECRQEWNDVYYYTGSGGHDKHVILGTHDAMSDHCMMTSDYPIKETLLDCVSTRYNKLSIIDWNVCKNLLFLKCNAEKGDPFLMTRVPATLQIDWFNTGTIGVWREDDIYYMEACLLAVMCKDGNSLFQMRDAGNYNCVVDEEGLTTILNYIDSLSSENSL